KSRDSAESVPRRAVSAALASGPDGGSTAPPDLWWPFHNSTRDTPASMAVAYGAADGFSYICAVYTCDCGSRKAMHAHKAGVLPRGWFSREGPEGLAHICP